MAVTNIYSGLGERTNWKVSKSKDHVLTVTVLNNSAAFDISSYTFVAKFYTLDGLKIPSAFLTLTQGNGITNGGATGIITITLTDTQTNLTANEYYWELTTTAPTDDRWFNGVFEIVDYLWDSGNSSSATVNLTTGGNNLTINLTLGGGSVTLAGATTVGGNIFSLTNPSAITFLRINADNTVTALSAANFLTALGVDTGFWKTTGTSTMTGTVTTAFGSNPWIVTTGVTTGTDATSGFDFQANSLTTGYGMNLRSSSVTSGRILRIERTSTVVNNTMGSDGAVTITSSGANSSSGKTAIGLDVRVTNTGTSNTNTAVYISASGATNNNALIAAAGNVRVDAGNLTVPGGQTGIGTSSLTSSTTLTVDRGSGFVYNNIVDFKSAGTSIWKLQGSAQINHLFTSSATGGGTQVGYLMNGTWQGSSGSAVNVGKSVEPTLNYTGTFTGTAIGYQYKATRTSVTGLNEYAFVSNGGLHGLGTLTPTPNTRTDIIGISSGSILRMANNSGTEKWNFQNDGSLLIGGSAGTSGQVLTSAGTGAAPTWTTIGGILGLMVNSVSPTSPNRTLTIVIDGTTYYLHAKTTND